jgi:hypothetical protein
MNSRWFNTFIYLIDPTYLRFLECISTRRIRRVSLCQIIQCNTQTASECRYDLASYDCIVLNDARCNLLVKSFKNPARDLERRRKYLSAEGYVSNVIRTGGKGKRALGDSFGIDESQSLLYTIVNLSGGRYARSRNVKTLTMTSSTLTKEKGRGEYAGI